MNERTQSGKRQPFVSTGHLPGGDRVRRLVEDAWQAARSNDDGQVSQVYPALARVPRDLFDVSLVSWAQGRIWSGVIDDWSSV